MHCVVVALFPAVGDDIRCGLVSVVFLSLAGNSLVYALHALNFTGYMLRGMLSLPRLLVQKEPVDPLVLDLLFLSTDWRLLPGGVAPIDEILMVLRLGWLALPVCWVRTRFGLLCSLASFLRSACFQWRSLPVHCSSTAYQCA